MKKQLCSVKAWLKSNKIFFEIATSVLLGVMAIVISFQANVISKSQAKIAEKELEYIKANNQALFNLDIYSIVDPVSNSTYEKRMEIFNYDGSITLDDINAISILSVTGFNDKDDYFKQIIYVPDYFSNVATKNRNKGLLVIINGYHNEKNMDTALSLVRDRLKESYKSMVINFNLRHVLRIKYKDVLDEKRVEYIVHDGVNYSIIPDDLGSSIFSEVDSYYLSDSINNNLFQLEMDDLDRLYDIVAKEFS